MNRLDLAYALIDRANSEDPNSVAVDGVVRPAETVYGERMTEALGRLYPDAPEVLKLAVRAQHLRRWTVPRSSYPMDRPGYLRWRHDLKKLHAEWAGPLFKEAGYSDDDIARAQSLIRKEGIKSNAEAQALEDVAALVFLEHYAMDFVPKHTAEKVQTILKKTFAKMSEDGRRAALAWAGMPAPVAEVVRSMLSPAPKTARARSAETPPLGLILAAHGDQAGVDPNAVLRATADRVRELTGLSFVRAGVLKGHPLIEEVLSEAEHEGVHRVVVYPLFMAAGYFVKKVLPERVRNAGFTGDVAFAEPLGLDLSMPKLMLDEAVAAAGKAGFAPGGTRLLIVGHGSKVGPASADATRLVASRLADLSPFKSIEVAFLEEEPFVEAALRASADPTVVLGFFFGDGLHAGEDVPEAISETGAAAIYAGSIGASAGIADVIQAALEVMVKNELRGA